MTPLVEPKMRHGIYGREEGSTKRGKSCPSAISGCVSQRLPVNTTAETTWDQQLGRASPSRDRNMSRLSICAIFKKEAAFLLEWIAYQRKNLALASLDKELCNAAVVLGVLVLGNTLT